jgi:lysozyme family protein
MSKIQENRMAEANFRRALDLVLKHEGGYVDHPRDPGGATNLGITIGTLGSHFGRKATKTEVKALTKETVAPIYRRRFWDAVKGDALPAGVDYCTFDAAVNSGPGRGVKWLQAALGVRQDGVLGPVTLAAAAKADPVEVIERMCDVRMAFLKRLSHWPTFGKGWSRRVAGVRAEGKRMASAKPVPVPAPHPAPLPSPQPTLAARSIPLKAVIAALTALAAAIGGLVAALSPLAN